MLHYFYQMVTNFGCLVLDGQVVEVSSWLLVAAENNPAESCETEPNQ